MIFEFLHQIGWKLFLEIGEVNLAFELTNNGVSVSDGITVMSMTSKLQITIKHR